MIEDEVEVLIMVWGMFNNWEFFKVLGFYDFKGFYMYMVNYDIVFDFIDKVVVLVGGGLMGV